MSFEAERRAGKVPEAVRRSGLSRSALYELAPKHEGLFKKYGRATIVDFTILDRIIDQLPVARLKQTENASKITA
jgi:hypothetical protein